MRITPPSRGMRLRVLIESPIPDRPGRMVGTACRYAPVELPGTVAMRKQFAEVHGGASGKRPDLRSQNRPRTLAAVSVHSRPISAGSVYPGFSRDVFGSLARECHESFAASYRLARAPRALLPRADVRWPHRRGKCWRRQRRSMPIRTPIIAVTQNNGPWMIIAHTFQGDNADEQAKALVYELRSKYKLPAYTHSKTFDFTQRMQGRGLDPHGKPKVMRYQQAANAERSRRAGGRLQHGRRSRAQKTLAKIKQMQPDALKDVDKRRQSTPQRIPPVAAAVPVGRQRQENQRPDGRTPSSPPIRCCRRNSSPPKASTSSCWK